MSIRRLLRAAAVGLCIAAALPASAQKPLLDVQANVSPQDLLYFEGTVAPRNLSPTGQLQVHNDVTVLVELIEPGGAFRTLPDRLLPTADEAYIGRRVLEGERLEGRDSTLVEISGQELLPEDEGLPFGVSGEVDLTGAQRFRIIARVRHQWAGTFPELECFYDISGPYPVKPGIARERRSGGLFSDVGRFLERSVGEIGRGVVQVGGQAAGLLLTGGANPVGILQALLLGEIQQQSGALGQALRFIGGAGGAGASLSGLDQLLSGGTSGRNDLTTTLARGLLARYGGDIGAGIAGAGGGDFDIDDLIDDAVSQLEEDLGARLGLRNLRVNVDASTATVISQMPSLEGRGHLEPIIAYMLVDAALAAPWTEVVTALFDSGSGSQMGIAAPAEAARNLARGQIDVETFLQLCRFADPDSPLLSSGGIVGGAAAPGGSVVSSAIRTLLPQAQLPAGWLASGTHTIEIGDLDQIIPGLQLSAQSISWGGMQVVQVNSQPVTVLGLELGEAGRALQLVQTLENAVSGQWDNNLLHLATDPPLHALQTGGRTYLLQGDAQPVAKVADLLASGVATAGVQQVGGLTALLPGMQTSLTGSTTPAGPEAAPPPATATPPAQPVEPAETTVLAPEVVTPAVPLPGPAPVVTGLPGEETVAPATPQPTAAEQIPEPVPLDRSGYLRKAYLCTTVEDGAPLELEGALPAGTDRVGVYLEIRGAPRGSVLAMELIREGFSQGRRMVGVGGDRRTVAYFAPSHGFSPGRYWLEISADDELVTRLLFEVE
ncbi:MAG: hypothetical protein ACOX9R_09395 [Armatimonadota bacterium]|jgi:hypothetical protein